MRLSQPRLSAVRTWTRMPSEEHTARCFFQAQSAPPAVQLPRQPPPSPKTARFRHFLTPQRPATIERKRRWPWSDIGAQRAGSPPADEDLDEH